MILRLFFLLTFSLSYAQGNYLYVKSYKSIDFLDEEKSKVTILSSNEYLMEIEPNLFLIKKKCRLKNLLIKVGNRYIKLNLKKYKNKKFIEISMFLNGNIENGNQNIKIERGDINMLSNDCTDNNCNYIVVKFPYLIIEKEMIKVKGNSIFDKYI